ncbi:MBG domain-containing protein [Flavobacterium sp. KS-LB2]|uniref:MBG domain-containing protein n=1 Tax=Flavobacterium sp. KS-LB2 TaxID=3120525 RepID=UPI0030CAE298
MKKNFTFILLGLLCIFSTNVSASLSPGDLAVIGMNAGPDGYSTPTIFTDPTRQFAIVALAAIPANEEIFITDCGWLNGSPGSFISQNFDGTIKFVPSAVIPAGTVMIFKLDTSTASKTISVSEPDGTVVPTTELTTSGWVSTGVSSPWNKDTGDQLLIYQGSATTPTFIFAFNNITTTAINSSNGWSYDPGTTSCSCFLKTSSGYCELPSTLPVGNSIGFFTSRTARFPNISYSPLAGMTSGSKADWLADIITPSRWTSSSSADTPQNFYAGFGAGKQKSFTIGSPTATDCTISATLTDVSTQSENFYDLLGQSFTACQSGKLSKIRVLYNEDSNPFDRTLTIRQGSGLSGNLLGTITIPKTSLVVATTGTDFTTIDVSSLNISVTSGQAYTFSFEGSDANKITLYYGNRSSPNVYESFYAGGVLYQDGVAKNNFDLIFEVEIVPGSAPTNTAPTNITLSSSSINENIAANSTVGTLSSTDADSGNTFTYTLISGTGDTDNGAFNIIGNELKIIASPDFQTKSSYSIRIRTTGQGGLSFEKNYTITINDLAEGVLLSSSPTLTFTSNSTAITVDNIASDGEGGSQAIADIDIKIYNISDSNGTFVSPLSWENSTFMSTISGSYSGLTNKNNAGSKGMAIKSADGSEFKLNQFEYHNWGESASFTNTVKGFRNGNEVASTTFEGYNSAAFDPITIFLNSSFSNVDEVRFYITSGGYLENQSSTNHSVNSIKVGPPVPTGNNAPTATSVSISGTHTIGQTLTGTYTYTDAENNTESGTTFKWYRSDNSSGLNKTAIASATSVTYTLVSADADKYISFEVTPGDGTAFGTAVESSKLGAVVSGSTGYQAIYDFENLGNNNTSFTSSTVNFTLTGNFIGQNIRDYGSDSPPSAGYTDTGFGADLSGNVGGLKTNNHEIFKLVSIDVWPSANAGSQPVLPYGTQIKIIGKRNGLQVAEGTYTSVTFNQTPDALGGNWHRVFVTGTLSSTDIDEFAVELLGTQNYMAVDQFSYKELRSAPTSTPPTVANPSNGSLISTTAPTYIGTATADATVTVYVDGASLGTTTATGGNWSLTQPAALAKGSHTVYATAQVIGNAVSANSTTNTFTVDSQGPSVVITSTAGATGGSTSTSPIPFTVTFSETVTGFVAGDITPANATISGFSGSGTTYTFYATPATNGVVTINIATNVAQDDATNSNTATSQFSITYTQTVISTATASQTNVSCNGGTNGSASVTPTGGASGYTYSWSPSGGTAATATGLAAGSYTVTVTDANGSTATRNFTITQPPAFSTATASQTNVSCNGGSNGSASVSPSGGAPGYTYSWSPSGGTAPTASGLSAGSYTVTVTDANGCSATRNFTITQPPAFSTATASQTNVSCNGGSNGSASVSPSGGTPGYTYFWSPSGGTAATASGLAAGSYTVTVTDANGCSATRNFTITQPPAFSTATASQTNVSCNGGSNGSASVSPSGGTPGYTYSWSPSGGTAATASGLSAGSYTVTVTDANGCSATRNFTITQPPAFSISTASQTNVSCNGGSNGSASVSPSGGAPGYTYSWSPSGGTAATASGLSAGSYTVTVTDANGCSATRNFTITQPPAFSISTASQTNVSYNGGSNGSASVAVSGGTAGYTYSWAPSGGTAATATGLSAGTYTVMVTDANACTATQSFTITEPSALMANPVAQTNLSCNGGTNGSATVAVSGGTAGYTYSWTPSGGTAATATGLSAGTYTVTVTDANACTATQSFTITEPSALVATPSAQTNVSCNAGSNGSVTVAVSGGSGPYTYSWAPSGGTAPTATGLSVGTYTVTVTDANACTASQSFTITQPSELSFTTTTLPGYDYGTLYTQTLNASGGIGTKTYTVTVGSLPSGFVLASNGTITGTSTQVADSNFTVTATDENSCTTSKSYILKLNQIPITVIPTPSQTKVYGQNDPILKFNVIPNLLPGDTFTGNLTRTAGENIGSYAINQGTLSAGDKYLITYLGANFSITAKPITVTANAKTKVYGTVDPTLTYSFSPSLVSGDTFTGALTRVVGENVGTYTINQNTLALNANYSITFVDATFSITKADQLITWNQIFDLGCEGETTVVLTATSNTGLPVSYTSSNSNSVSVSGNALNLLNYGSVTITASQLGNNNYKPAPIVVLPLVNRQPNLIRKQFEDIIFFDNSSRSFKSYSWYKNGALVPSQTNQYFKENGALNGTYYAVATKLDGTLITTCPLTLSPTVEEEYIRIAPNPVRGNADFQLITNVSSSRLQNARIEMFNAIGSLLLTVNTNQNTVDLKAPNVQGIYIVKMTLANGKYFTKNLLVKN